MPKKVCFVSTVSITMKCFILPIACELASEGIEVTLICNNDQDLMKLCKENKINYYPVPMGRGINVSGFKAIKTLRLFFLSRDFDVVQYCTPNASFYASVAAKQARVPIRLYCQWGIRYVGLNGIGRIVFKQIEKTICRYSTNIRAVSKLNKAFAVSEGLYKSEKALVIGNGGTVGVDLTIFDINKKEELNQKNRQLLNIPNDAFVYGFCGRLSKDKGSNELLSAFKNISEDNKDVFLLIVGDVENVSNIDKKLFNWAKTSRQVVFAGNVSRNNINGYYSLMNVLVHPTYREGFGMVIQEAGAYGVPCITTNIPGASEVMVDGESCILVDVKNNASLEKSMREIASDKELLKRLGEKAYERTILFYSRKVMLQNQKKDYIELLNNLQMKDV